MKKKMFTTILAGAFAATAILPLAVQAGRGNGPMGGTSQTQSGTRDRLRDGTCTTSTTTQAGTGTRAGKVYGTGDGTGNMGTGPKDGTGYGAPSSR